MLFSLSIAKKSDLQFKKNQAAPLKAKNSKKGATKPETDNFDDDDDANSLLA